MAAIAKPSTAAVGLRLAPGLALPTTVFPQVVALLAKRGAGRNPYTAAVLVEEMVAAGGQVVILDPVGA